jgi:hypothetical protein
MTSPAPDPRDRGELQATSVLLARAARVLSGAERGRPVTAADARQLRALCGRLGGLIAVVERAA